MESPPHRHTIVYMEPATELKVAGFNRRAATASVADCMGGTIAMKLLQ